MDITSVIREYFQFECYADYNNAAILANTLYEN